MKQDIIDLVKSLGFKVYMKNPKDTWLYFTEGDKIGYLQEYYYGGYSISTCCIPNKQCGSGFALGQVDKIDYKTLKKAFYIPCWANSMDRESSKPWPNFESFNRMGLFPNEYKEV